MTTPLTSDNAVLRHKIKCKHSGLVIGIIEVSTVAGAIPYLSHWDASIAYHPVFSLDMQRLLKHAKDEWKRLAQPDTDREIAQRESESLCVNHLALLHSLDCVKQDYACLPSLEVVHSTIGKLFVLAHWKWHLESKRFRFPTLHISKYNKNEDFSNLADYLQVCFDVKSAYENDVRDAEEQEKLRVAEKAILALNNQWVTPTNKRVLWQWVRAHLPEKYKPDAEGWLSTLFLGGSAAIVDFDEEDIDLAEEIIVSSCPVGTGVMHAIRQRLSVVRQTWEQHNAAFRIDLEDYAEGANLLVNGIKVAAPDPGPEPTMASVEYNKVKFLVAHAKWTIAQRAWLAQQNRGTKL